MADYDIEHNKLVERLVNNPAHVPKLAVFVGFPGRAEHDATHVRIYRSLSLESHIDIPRASVKAAIHLGESDLDPTAVWVEADTQVQLPLKSTTASSYLAGAIVSEYSASAIAPGFPGGFPGGFNPGGFTSNLCPRRLTAHSCGGTCDT